MNYARQFLSKMIFLHYPYKYELNIMNKLNRLSLTAYLPARLHGCLVVQVLDGDLKTLVKLQRFSN